MMLAVAAVIATSGGIFMNHKGHSIDADRCREIADAYQSTDDFENAGIATGQGPRWYAYASKIIVPDIRAHAKGRAYRDQRAAHFRSLQQKHERAARFPWFPVAFERLESK
jgi:hypothetical protein